MNDNTILDENRDVYSMRAPDTEEFESWLNSDVYGYAVQEFDENTQEWNTIEIMYGIYGIDALRGYERRVRADYDAIYNNGTTTSGEQK